MALHLVTGYSGKAHITSADQGALNAATFGRGNYVLNVGQQFAANVITNNSINVLDGEVIMQGRHIRLESGAYEEVTIENGTQEYFRNDLICIRYTKDSTTGIENAAFVVIKGNPDASAAVDPAHNNGNILDGILTVDFPLYRVPLNGLNIGDLVPLFEAKGSIDERIAGKVDKEAGKGLSTNDYSNAEKKQVADNKTDIANLKDGTTPAGNALQLGGKSASEYALAETVLNEPILEKVKTLQDGIYEYKLGGYGYTGSDLPHRNYAWGYATVYVHSNAYREVVLHGYGSLRPVYNHFIDGAWLGWTENATTADLANYLPLSGGTITPVDSDTGIIINSTRTDMIMSLIQFYNQSTYLGYLGFNSNGPIAIGKDFLVRQLLHTGNVGDYALPKSGGTLNGKFVLDSNGATGVGFYNANGDMVIGANNSTSEGVMIGGVNTETLVRSSGVNDLYHVAGTVKYNILTTGNSAKVAIQETAPTDTTALWVY